MTVRDCGYFIFLELQKQLQLSEAKSQNLSADKTKLVGVPIGCPPSNIPLVQSHKSTTYTQLDKRIYHNT